MKTLAVLPQTSLYLFLAPLQITHVDSVPYFSLNNPAYFWSSDPRGRVRRTEMELLLGFLQPACMTSASYVTSLQHDAAAEYVKSQGYKSGVEYALAHQLPIFDAFRDDNAFEIIEAEGESLRHLSISLKIIIEEVEIESLALDEDWELLADAKVFCELESELAGELGVHTRTVGTRVS